MIKDSFLIKIKSKLISLKVDFKILTSISFNANLIIIKKKIKILKLLLGDLYKAFLKFIKYT